MTKIEILREVIVHNKVNGRAPAKPPIQVTHPNGQVEQVFRADLTSAQGEVVASVVYEPDASPSVYVIAATTVLTTSKKPTVKPGSTRQRKKCGSCP